MIIFYTIKNFAMNRIVKMMSLMIGVILLSFLSNTSIAQGQPDDEVSYQTFYDNLSPYGDWIEYPDYGYVWQPRLGADFRPYSTGGHWVWSDEYDWVWVSDYDWGWAPFHYGRWFYDSYYGWLWVPGYEWSPAWVAWRSGGDYYGWAPLRPGINISVGFSLGGYYAPDNYWCFAERQYITSPRIYDYCVPWRQNTVIISNTTIINNYRFSRNTFVTGPGRNEVQRYTHERINPVRFRDMSRPGRNEFRNNEVSIYRPSVRRDNERSTPARFDRYNQGRNGRDIVRTDNRDRGSQPGNNLPTRRDNNNGGFNRNNGINGRDNSGNNQRGRNNNDVFNRRPQAQPGNIDPNRGFERRPQVNNDNRSTDSRRNNNFNNNRAPQTPQVNNNNSRVFERRNMNNGNNNRNNQVNNQQPFRQSRPQMERPQAQPRNFDQPGRSTERQSTGNNGTNNGNRGRRHG